MEPIRQFSTRAVALPVDDVDTDQIIPARFLKGTSRDGLGAALFADWRHLPDGTPDPRFPLNAPRAGGAGMLVAGHNFGCGSSREHAAWALVDRGFRAVVSTEFADIFRNNAIGNGLLPVQLEPTAHARLLALLRAQPDAEIIVDLASRTLTLPDGTAASFPIDSFARHCLLQGVDRLGFLLAAEDEIARHETAHAADPLTAGVRP